MDIEFKDNSKQVKEKFQRQLEQALQRIGLEWLENVTPLVPVDTGKLRQSMTFEVDFNNKCVIVGSTIKDPLYPIFVEIGTRNQRAQPYLRPSIMNYISDYENAVREMMGRDWNVKF